MCGRCLICANWNCVIIYVFQLLGTTLSQVQTSCALLPEWWWWCLPLSRNVEETIYILWDGYLLFIPIGNQKKLLWTWNIHCVFWAVVVSSIPVNLQTRGSLGTLILFLLKKVQIDLTFYTSYCIWFVVTYLMLHNLCVGVCALVEIIIIWFRCV
jgi:hypothetical protein